MFAIQISGGTPISEQLFTHISELIISGALKENEKLPAVREVAKELAINPNTVQKVYQLLEQKGFTYSLPGKGSYVKGRADYQDELRQSATDDFETAVTKALKKGLSEEELIDIIKSITEKG